MTGRRGRAPRLVLAAHGSADPRYPGVITAIGSSVSALLGREAAVAYLDHCWPSLGDVARPGDVVVPMLLSTGYHATVDIPSLAPGCRVAAPLGPDPRLVAACADRLLAAGYRGGPVVLAAAGSSDPRGTADVEAVAVGLARQLGWPVTPAYLSAALPRLSDVAARASAVVPYLLAPGRFADRALGCGAPIVADVLGHHPAIAEIIRERAEEALTSGDVRVKAG